jgi:outer membrane protein insertion porin family
VLGSTKLKDYEIQKHIHTRRDREFDPDLVQADVRRLVTTGLFKDVKTFTRPGEGGVVVIFEVFERPRINYLKHIGNRGISEKKLIKEHGLKQGDPLNTYSVEEARRKVEELYHTEGYPKATVSILEGDKPGDQGLVLLINEGQVERVGSVTFEGNTIASDSRLKTQIESKPGFMWYFFGGKVDRAKLDADVKTLTVYYRNLGYFRARVGREITFDESGKWIDLKFVIDEGPRYVVRNVSVEGNTKFASAPLLEFLQLKSGQHYNQSAMNRDLNTIVDLYGSQGHVFADVQADPRFLEEPGQIDLVYRIQEGEVFKVSEINVNIAGEYPHTRQTVVLNRLSLRPGEIIDTRELRHSERRLKSSQLFEVNPQDGEPPRIAVRPPSADSIGNIAAQPKPGTIRGQQPESTSDVADRYFPRPHGPSLPTHPAGSGDPSSVPQTQNRYR